MATIQTKYGLLKGATYIQSYPDGSIKECTLTEENQLTTSYGILIPQYLDDGYRRKKIKPISFYPNGSLKNVPLQNQIEIATTLGVLPVEAVSFYENGSIHRIFPLDGKLSGFWTEDDEYALARNFNLNLAFGQFNLKFIGVQFYENGAVKSITLWPKDEIDVETPIGTVPVRIGISLYPDGQIKSLEPGKPLPVNTSIGTITAYDRNALGLHGDVNSLKFSEDGKIESVTTSANMVRVTAENGQEHIYQPLSKPGMFNPAVNERVPMRIQFFGNQIAFNNNDEIYNITECNFSVEPFTTNNNQCSSCNGCSECG